MIDTQYYNQVDKHLLSLSNMDVIVSWQILSSFAVPYRKKPDSISQGFNSFCLSLYLRNNKFYKWSTCDNILYNSRNILRI